MFYTAAIHVAIGTVTGYSYNDALRAYKTSIAKSGSSQITNDREVKEQNQGRGRGGRGGFGRGSGRGYSGRGRDGIVRGRGYSERGRGDYYQTNVPKTVDGSVFFNLSDGTTRIEYHPDIDYPPDIYNKFTSEQKDMLDNDRANETVTPSPSNSYGGGSSGGYNKQKIQQLEQQVWDLQSQSQPRDYRQSSQAPEQQIP